MVETEAKVRALHDALRACGSVCVGYSGGVDSVYLAAVALEVLGGENVLAVTGRSPSYPEVQRAVAVECARRLGLRHVEIDTDELDDPNYASNPSNRCYFCKSELWPKLTAVAGAHSLAVVLDGSNADDAHDYRPGFQAARENGVRAPLLEVGLTKAEIRELSRALALPTWDQPSAPCLSSRLPYGIAVTRERLRQVERAETALRALGFREFRVRHHDDCARVELSPGELAHALERAREIHAQLRAAGMPRVLLDAEGYRRGALNETLVQLDPGRPPTTPSALPPHDVAGHHGDIAVLHGAELSHARAAAPALRAAGFRYIAIDTAAAIV